jgi:glycerophosphoryl diester phosphodiesterase
MRLFLFLCLLTSLHAAPKLIAHRGASEAAPENTLAAFRQAWEEGADGIEADFLLSKDGKIVCFHDRDTKRITGKKLIIAETPWTTLSQLDVGAWKGAEFAGERIPLLDEVIAALPEKKFFFVEIKCGPEIVPALRPALIGADPDYVMLICFNAAVIKACREQLPEFQAHLLSSLDNIHKKDGQQTQLAQLGEIDATGLQFKHSAKVTKAFIKTIQARNRLTACWTVNDPATAARVAALGVDFITTDRPAALRRDTKWPD